MSEVTGRAALETAMMLNAGTPVRFRFNGEGVYTTGLYLGEEPEFGALVFFTGTGENGCVSICPDYILDCLVIFDFNIDNIDRNEVNELTIMMKN